MLFNLYAFVMPFCDMCYVDQFLCSQKCARSHVGLFVVWLTTPLFNLIVLFLCLCFWCSTQNKYQAYKKEINYWCYIQPAFSLASFSHSTPCRSGLLTETLSAHPTFTPPEPYHPYSSFNWGLYCICVHCSRRSWNLCVALRYVSIWELGKHGREYKQLKLNQLMDKDENSQHQI